MAYQRWMLAVCFSFLFFSLASGGSVSTTETTETIYTCRTFGSGVVQTFNSSLFYVRSTCAFTLTRFTHNRVECDITIQRGDTGLLSRVEIIINNIRTILQNGSVLVEQKSVSLPYDHTYQHVFHYGIYTKLRSSLLPLSVTWHNVPGGIDTLWVELEQELSSGMTGLCGAPLLFGNKQQLIADSELPDNTCQTRDPASNTSIACRRFLYPSSACLRARTSHYIQLCEKNIYSYERNVYIGCAFFKEVVQQCGRDSRIWKLWRTITNCNEPTCPGELLYEELGEAFVPSCSNPNPRASDQDLTSSCVCPMGKVLNDRAPGYDCVNVAECPCVYNGRSFPPGYRYTTKCLFCLCLSGTWKCSLSPCPARCLIEGQFVTTFDGKQYAVPGKCSYVASQGFNWTISIQFSETAYSLKTVILNLNQGFHTQYLWNTAMYTFSRNMVKIGETEIVEFHQSDHAIVFWQSSMYVQVQTSFGLKIQVQMSPEIQLYITPPGDHTGLTSGLCGNNNADTTDDFTTSSGITENLAQPFALSWSMGDCTSTPTPCINTDNEIFADEKCSVLRDPSGIFAKCYNHIPTDYYHMACIQTTCNCGGGLQQCLCVALANYATACASQGVLVGDWRKATNCTLTCINNQEFSYDMRACNRTCHSLSGPDPRCGVDDAPVEGCGCLEGTHLNQGLTCTPKAQCPCHHQGGTTPPGPVAIEGRQCHCENGKLNCSMDCVCRNGKVCVHCSQSPVNTTQKTCDSLSKPLSAGMMCQSGCYCPDGQYEDHHGDCVSLDNCTCVYSGKVFSGGESVKTNCETCMCSQGEWHCKNEPCSGKCQVYGNGHYQTFDSKWFRFDGACQYTLVEDDCGSGNGSFSISVESVPCCDEALTCSRSIVLYLRDQVTLTLADMRVTRRRHTDREAEVVSIHTVGLYIIISVPSKDLILIWDKNTRITIELGSLWRNRVCGLCGNFDSSEMNDLQIRGSTVVSSFLAFGNSWKTAMPPCSDVKNETFPCKRHSYCSAWAQRRCMILKGDTFKACHFKVDPEPFYQACVLESCACEFEGKFLGFCTAVAAYAEACSDQDICVYWRTPDMCPVYCDYYNEQGQCSWHYEPCGQIPTCGKKPHFTGKLEGCYPRCPAEAPYYDENTGECSTLTNCTCYFNDTVIQPRTVLRIDTKQCSCKNGTIECDDVITTTTTPTTTTTTVTTPTTTTVTTPTTTTTTVTTPTTTTVTTPTTTSTSTSTTPVTSWSTQPTTTTPSTTPATGKLYTCNCTDLKRNQSWFCGQTWTEDCFNKTCTKGKILLTPVVCPEATIPSCPRGQVRKVSDGCCDTWRCDCLCYLYGDPHYISFQGVPFDFLESCTYVLVEERSPRHHLTIAVDNFLCDPGRPVSCAKGIILKYQNNTATLSIIPNKFKIEATLNNVRIQPPYEENGLKFETTGYMVSVFLPEVRSHVSFTPAYRLVVSLAMEHFLNNTQGQCGVCGGGSCIRRGGLIEEDSCCDKTAYDWVYPDPLKPACAAAPRDMPCSVNVTPPTTCPGSPLCHLLNSVFAECDKFVDLNLRGRNCRFDSCASSELACSSLEQTAEECRKAGLCIDWRRHTNGSCDVECPKGLVYGECRDKLDDVCNGGVSFPGTVLQDPTEGCFCPNQMFRAGNHTNHCVSECSYCKGPLGEPKLPGEEWQSGCHMCRCNIQTRTEECRPKPPMPTPVCNDSSVLVNISNMCCGEQICTEKKCSYNEETYKVGDRWRDAAHPCVTYSCSREGIQTETKICPSESCPEEDRMWDDQHCCLISCKDVPSDLLFLIDASGSINAADFQKMKDFMKSVINKTAIGQNEVHIGIMQFSSGQSLEFPLNRYYDKTEMWGAIDQMQRISGGTRTGAAIDHISQYFEAVNGGRPDVAQRLIVITDGRSQDEVSSPAAALRAKGVIIYAIGVVNANTDQLLEISGTLDRVYSARDFDALKDLESELAMTLCDSGGHQSCVPTVSSVNITIDNCTTTLQLPMCQGQCASQLSWVVCHGVLQSEHRCRCCKEQTSEMRSVALQCSDSSTRNHYYQHITSCQCRGCSMH